MFPLIWNPWPFLNLPSTDHLKAIVKMFQEGLGAYFIIINILMPVKI